MAEDRTEFAKEFLKRSLAVSPGGAQTRSKRHQSFPENFPVGLVCGQGSHVWDIEGTEYIDWICGLGAVSLGYKYPSVHGAVLEQLTDGGPSWSIPHKLEVETSESLLELLKWPEQVRWVKTGSEATVGAMMIARRATGRDLVISIGYHGWHEAHLDSDKVHSMSMYPNLADVENLLYRTAAVLLEPVREEAPPHNYFKNLLLMCRYYGSLLISDECVAGFRWAIGGGSEYFGYEPDLAVFGKGIANGYPLACIVGRAGLMRHAVDVSGTYGGEAVSLAACKATLEVYREHDVIGHMWKLGQQFIDAGLAQGYPCHPKLTGDSKAAVARAAAGGVLFHPAGFNISYSHTQADVDKSLEALK